MLRRTRPSANVVVSLLHRPYELLQLTDILQVSHKDKIYFHAVFVAYVAALGTNYPFCR